MLKFDERNAPEDATGPPEMIFCELLNSKPSLDGLHQTKGGVANRFGETILVSRLPRLRHEGKYKRRRLRPPVSARYGTGLAPGP